MLAIAKKRFRSIQFYSAWVYWLKRILPAIAVSLLLLLTVWPSLMQNDKSFRIEASDVAQTAQQTSLIVGPRYMGVTSDNRPYTVAASAAAPVAGQPMAVNLSKLQVDVTISEELKLLLKADRATYWRDRNGMVVSGNVTVTSSTGYEIRANHIYADFASGMIWNDTPIIGQSPLGQFYAQGFRAKSNGDNIELLGQSRIFLKPRSIDTIPDQQG